MSDLILSTRFSAIFNGLQENMPQSILLTGLSGVGLMTIAVNLANEATALVVQPVRLTKTSTTKQISIQMIRELYDDVRTNAKRVVVIDDADTMTVAAQNALLKLLEEPNKQTRFILTSHHPELLLPTIRSRVASYHVPLVDTDTAFVDILQQFDRAKQRQLSFLSKGKPAELYRLSCDDDYFMKVAEETGFAKKLISGSGYERVVLINKMKFDRDTTLRVIERAVDLLERTPTAKTLPMITSLIDAYTAILRGGNMKLQLTRAML